MHLSKGIATRLGVLGVLVFACGELSTLVLLCITEWMILYFREGCISRLNAVNCVVSLLKFMVMLKH